MLQSVTHVHSRAAPDVPTESERDKLQAAPRLHLRFLREMPSRRPAGRPCGRTRPWPCRCSLQKGKNDLAPGRAHGAPSGAGGERCGVGPLPCRPAGCARQNDLAPCGGGARRRSRHQVVCPGRVTLCLLGVVLSKVAHRFPGRNGFVPIPPFPSFSTRCTARMPCPHDDGSLLPAGASLLRFHRRASGPRGRQMDGLADVRGRISAAATPRSTRRPPFYCDARSLW